MKLFWVMATGVGGDSRGPPLPRLHCEEREDCIEHVVIVKRETLPDAILHLRVSSAVCVDKVLAPETVHTPVSSTRYSSRIKHRLWLVVQGTHLTSNTGSR